MNTCEYPRNPLENSSIKTNALDGFSRDYAGIYRYFLVMRRHIYLYRGVFCISAVGAPYCFSKEGA